ncbi:MAG: helix-turn-helix transcriptional regulator [Spirochaetaceae bacterium]|nr:helix-turn-helix transcriptional regulator [Spirochaetaceae bacterium]
MRLIEPPGCDCYIQVDILSAMNLVARLRRRTGLTQVALAELAGTSQPTIAAYESGTKRPSLRTLERLAAAAGLGVHVAFVPHLTREDRRSLALHERIADRLRAAPSETLARAVANLRRMRNLHPGASALLDEWERLLHGSPDVLVDALINPGLHFRELRHVTPFAGVLSAPERAAVYREFRRGEMRR